MKKFLVRVVLFALMIWLFSLLCVLWHHFYPKTDLSPIIRCFSLLMGAYFTGIVILYCRDRQYQ